MLITGNRLLSTPVLGLQTGSELARTKTAIIDPATLKIHAYELQGPLLNSHPSILRIADIREISDIGLIVDSSDEFVGLEDVIKISELYELRFKLIGMAVIDIKGSKLGKVNGYSLSTTDFLIYQLSVKRPLFKSLSDTELLIHRSQITEINNDAIVVHSEAEIAEPVLESVRKSYVNPFRSKPTSEQPSNARVI